MVGLILLPPVAKFACHKLAATMLLGCPGQGDDAVCCFALVTRGLVLRDAPIRPPSQPGLLGIPWKGAVLARTGFVERFLKLLAEGGGMDKSESRVSGRCI